MLTWLECEYAGAGAASRLVLHRYFFIIKVSDGENYDNDEYYANDDDEYEYNDDDVESTLLMLMTPEP